MAEETAGEEVVVMGRWQWRKQRWGLCWVVVGGDHGRTGSKERDADDGDSGRT